MGILSWLLLGLIAGVVAKVLMPGRDPGGLIMTILLGIAGALLGGFLASLFGLGGVNELSFMSILIAVAGALLLLVIFRSFRRRRFI